MTLSEFIQGHVEDILAEWQRFARTMPGSIGLDRAGLRDHVDGLLRTVAREMETQPVRASPRADLNRDVPANTAAQMHALQRLDEGFDINEIVAEYCALRSAVIGLWVKSVQSPQDFLAETVRFNTALDRALIQSVGRYASQLDRRRELFMGVLGHDLRAPLQVITASAARLKKGAGLLPEDTQMTAHIQEGASQISAMVSDLLDVARTRLGSTLPVEPAPMDLGATCRAVIDGSLAVHPERTIRLTLAGDLRGTWDASRMEQLLGNLVRNALQHGSKAEPIEVDATGDDAAVTLKVHNKGAPIAKRELLNIFEPLVSGCTEKQGEEPHRRSANLGLGLYIAATIVKAHQGTIDVESSRHHGTTFSVRLPRQI